MTTFLTIDIGGSSVKSALVDIQSGNLPILRNKKRHELTELTIIHLTGIVRNIVGEYGSEQIAGIGISTVGSVTPEGIVVSGRNIRGYTGFDWKQELSDQKLPIKIMNDAQAALTGLHVADPEITGTDTFAHIVIGSGVGGGIMMNGSPWLGANGFAGHFGIMNTPSGMRLEHMTSAKGIELFVDEFTREGLTFHEILNRLDESKIRHGIIKSAQMLGLTISNVIYSLDPGIIVLGGGVIEAFGGTAENLYIREALAAAGRYTAPRGWENTQVIVSSLGNDATLYGMASDLAKSVTVE